MDCFWSKADKSGECWTWTGLRDKNGYGRIMINYRHLRAHRAAWEIVNGEIPKGLFVCHRCDNPPCVNPAHLFLGTLLDNAADMKRNGRAARGARNGMAKHPERSHFARVKFIFKGEAVATSKLTDDAVRDIRREYAYRRVPLRVFATRYGVGISAIHRIVKGTHWRHV